MLEIAIMIEGQNGLNWERWQKIARLVEDLGFVGFIAPTISRIAIRSDLDSLELWTSSPGWRAIRNASSLVHW